VLTPPPASGRPEPGTCATPGLLDAPGGRGTPWAVVPPAPADLTLRPQNRLLLIAGFTTLLLAAIATLLPVPYALLKPGPTINTLGESEGKKLIVISDRKTYPTEGHLDLTTVSLFGGPGHRINLWQAVQGWADSSISVLPKDVLFPPGQSEEESQEQTEQEMVSSQESATAAALETLGISVPSTLTVAGIDERSPASKTLRDQDVLLTIGGSEIDGMADLRSRLETVKAGGGVRLTVRRNGAVRAVDVTTMASPVDGHTMLGIYLDQEFRFPFNVKIQIDDVGGPSAGTMFALGIIDMLTPGALTGGRRIAGTGTMDADGVVGPIGGIQQKLVGARRAGADWFLAPADNCSEVVGHVPDGLRVVKVATLKQAWQALERIGADRDVGSLATCTAD
jgi:Lon-like protease